MELPLLLAWHDGSDELPKAQMNPFLSSTRCTMHTLPSMMVTGSSICGRSILGPKTVARFWTLILLTSEWD